MVDVLESGLVEMRWNGRVALLNLHFLRGRSGFIFVVVVVALAGEILGAFVFMGRSKLDGHEVLASMPIVERNATYILIATKGIGHVTG